MGRAGKPRRSTTREQALSTAGGGGDKPKVAPLSNEEMFEVMKAQKTASRLSTRSNVGYCRKKRR